MFRRDGGQGPEQEEQLGPGSYTEGRRGYALCKGGGGQGPVKELQEQPL